MRVLQKVLSVVLLTQVYTSEKRFSVPRAVLEVLEIDTSVALSVRKLSGALVFIGEKELKSGPEVYGKEFDSLVFKEMLWVEIAKAPK